MSDEYEPMDGFSPDERIAALKRAKLKLEQDLEIFKLEEIDAFVLVKSMDETLKVYNSPELREKRRQKYEWAKSLRWNLIHQEKQIQLCIEAIQREENPPDAAHGENSSETVLEE